MAKIDLKRSSGLPIFYSGEDLLPQGLTVSDTTTVCIDDIRPQLLNEDLNCPAVFYKRYKDIDKDDVFKKKNIRINIYLLFSNLAGIEYSKTIATKCKSYPRILDVAYGGGIIILQKYEGEDENKVIKIVTKKQQKIIVPPGYAFSLINSRQNSAFILVEMHSRDARPRDVLDERKGMSYYIIRKNAKQETVRNPEYKKVQELEEIDLEAILKKYGVTPKTPVVKQIMRKYERFNWLFEKDSVDL